MRTSYLSASCAAAMCVFLNSFATPNQQPVDNGGINIDNNAVASPVQDTVPQHSAGVKSGKTGNKSAESQSSMGQGNQRSDTRGEGTKKGRKGMEKGSVDSTNHGAINTTDTTRA